MPTTSNISLSSSQAMSNSSILYQQQKHSKFQADTLQSADIPNIYGIRFARYFDRKSMLQTRNLVQSE